MQPRLLNIQSVCTYLSIPRTTYYTAIHPAVQRDEISSVNFGRQVLICRLSLDAWIDKRLKEQGNGTARDQI